MIHAPRRANLADLYALSPPLAQAIRETHRYLDDKKIRHVLVGGAALAAYGYLRMTRDVDFLVGDEAFPTSGLIVTSPVPVSVGGVAIDTVPLVPSDPSLRFYETLLSIHTTADDGVPIVSLAGLIAMKLVAARPRDLDDVAELLRVQEDVEQVVVDCREALRSFATSDAVKKRFEKIALALGQEPA